MSVETEFKVEIGDIVTLNNGQGPMVVNARHYNDSTGRYQVELIWLNDMESIQRAIVDQETLIVNRME